ncbi:hypothetical protein [Membranihabitans maritimus]|uniref:hypothetical protein n=1 Tax=Membranihabitans maritimus TaxID=2904244 RepID=UPI001F2CDA92|nr:hypothetical protein [Membranihabitans maritimus]
MEQDRTTSDQLFGQSPPMEQILLNNSAESVRERIQLIRILSRSSTLPKISNIHIRSVHSRPDIFFINPGQSINIGVNLLSSPIATLFCLRYGIEWQIWYKRLPKDKMDVRICDLAACRVAAKFYELTPKEDKKVIDQLPPDIVNIILKFNDHFIPSLEKSDFEILGQLHNRPYPEYDLDPDLVDVLFYLAKPSESLLMSGGDLRMNVDPEALLNVYGCRPFPRPEAYTFASSTATSVSNVAFNHTEIKREVLIRNSLKKDIQNTIVSFPAEVKSKLKKVLSIPSSSGLIMAPSGTDISLRIAGMCQSVFANEVVHILVASDETGSGVPLALAGQHFSDTTACGYDVKRGEWVDGFRKTDVHTITLRDEAGSLKDPEVIDIEISHTIKEVLEGGRQPVLHIMDQSKLGFSAPGKKSIQNIQKEFGNNVLMVVDNSQLRMDHEELKWYLEREILMTITGSKFFTGPPFSGALIIPKKLNEKWGKQQINLPEGLFEYAHVNEWPETWKINSEFPRGINFGMYLRWYASIVEMERYFQTPVTLRHLGIEMFCEHVKESISQAGFLELINEYNTNQDEKNTVENTGSRRTIFPFFVKTGNRILSLDEVKKVYQLLNKNLTPLLTNQSDDSKRLSAQVCHIGQPVKSTHSNGTISGYIRISLGSRVISESWKDRDVSIFFQKIEDQMNQVDIIIRKLEMILNHPEWFE